MTEKVIRIILDSSKAEESAKKLNDSMINIGANADKVNVSMRNVTDNSTRNYNRTRQVTNEISKVTNDYRKINNETTRFVNDQRVITQNITKITNDYRQIANSTGRLQSDLQGTNNELSGINTKLNGVATAIASIFSAQRIIEYADAFTNVQNQLRQTVNTQADLEESTRRIIAIAVETRANLEATSKLYTRLRLSVDESVVSTEDLYRVTETVNKGLALSGATALEAQGALLQFSQAIASGVLRGQEFNSISEQSPVILKALQVSLNKTQGELRAFAAEGGITTDILIKAIKDYSDTVDRQFSKSTRTFSQSLEVARTETIAFVGASELIGRTMTLAGDTIVGIASNLKTLQDILTGLALVFGAKMVASIAAATGAFVTNQAAALRATVTYDALGVAITRTTVAMNGAALATKALTAAISFLGGPLGVAIIAAGALVYFNERLEEIKTKETAEEIDKLIAKFKELDETGKKIEINKLERERNSLIERRAEAQAELDALKGKPTNTGGFLATGGTDGLKQNVEQSALGVELAGIEERLNKIAKLQVAVFNVDLPEISKKLNTPKESKPDSGIAKGENKFDKLLEDSIFQSDLLTSELSNENDIIQNALNSRISIYKKYGATLNNVWASEYERRIAQIEIQAEAEKTRAQEQLSNDLASNQERLQKILENETYSEVAKEEAIKSLREQNLLNKQVYEQTLTEIEAQARAQREQAAIEETQRSIAMQQQIQNTYLDTAQIGLGALVNLIGGSKKAGKALRLVQAGISAFQVYANHEAAAAQILATPPGPILNPTLVALAAATSTKGKVSAAAIMAAAAAETFSGGGSGSSGISSAGSGTSAAPQLPQAPETVQSLSIVGNEDIVRQLEELTASDAQIPARIMLRYLNSIEAAKRIGA